MGTPEPVSDDRTAAVVRPLVLRPWVRGALSCRAPSSHLLNTGGTAGRARAPPIGRPDGLLSRTDLRISSRANTCPRPYAWPVRARTYGPVRRAPGPCRCAASAAGQAA